MRLYRCSLVIFVLAGAVMAGSKKLGDYPLRIHVYRRTATTFYHSRIEEETKGQGRANLFENGEPRGLDFEFECSKILPTSSGFETFPARWKKPNQELIVLIPEFGKTGSYSTCKFEVQMKDFAYFGRNGVLNTEPTAMFKKWMTEHDYDPERGKDMPTPTKRSAPEPAVPAKPSDLREPPNVPRDF